MLSVFVMILKENIQNENRLNRGKSVVISPPKHRKTRRGSGFFRVWFVKCIIKREVSDLHSHYEKTTIFSSGISDTMCVW